MTAAKLFIGGIPTGPDVRRLLDRFKDAGRGDSIPLAEVAEELQIGQRDGRFRTVIDAFRRALARRGLATDREPGSGVIRILREDERAGHGLRGIRRGVRKIARSHSVVAETRTELLDEKARDTSMHVKRLGEALLKSARDSVKEMAAPFTAPQQLPRRAAK